MIGASGVPKSKLSGKVLIVGAEKGETKITVKRL